MSGSDDEDAGWKFSHPPHPSSAEAQGHVYDAFSEPEAWDAQRMMIEEGMLHFHTDGIAADDADGLMEATRRWTVDLLDMGHYPSRHMLAMISGELKALYWPGDKPIKRTEEAAWLFSVEQQIDHLIATKYRDSRAPKTSAEEEVAELLKLDVGVLRRKRTRFRARLEQREAEEERQRREAVLKRRSRRRSKQ